jgi:hypothetical protein
MDGRVSDMTAYWIAAARARESGRPDRLSVPGAPDANFGRRPAVPPGRHAGAAHLTALERS